VRGSSCWAMDDGSGLVLGATNAICGLDGACEDGLQPPAEK
jgi:hypothetical protein